MNRLKRWTDKVGIVLGLGGLLLTSVANAIDGASLKRNHNPYQQTLLKYKAKQNSAQATNSKRSAITPFIVGGVDAKPSAYPWMAALLVAEIPNANDALFCGGSLVLPDVVVTAAHCLDFLPGKESVEVAVGAYDLLQVGAEQRIKVRGYVIHPNYDPSTADSDIGIIKLEHPVLAPTLPLISTQQMSQLMPGEMLTVIGFGALNDPPVDFPNILQEVKLAYVDHNVCNDTMSSVGAPITDTQICAGNIGQIQDSCYGDSGGPLMANINGEWRLTGIVSWGLGCGLPDFYGVYTEAADFVQWIHDTAYSLYVPNRVYFSFLSLGRKRTKHIRIDNWSQDKVNITRLSLQDRGLGYAITNTTCEDVSLAPNQTCGIDLKFEPAMQGRLKTQLHVSSSAGELSTELAGVGLGEIDASRALDSEELDWFSGPELNWQQVAMAEAVNGSAMQAGAITDRQNTALLTYVNGPGTISFNWKVSSELDYDYLFLVVDGYIVDAISGDVDWIANSYDISGRGEHAVMWVYDKDEYVSDLMDSAWLDNVAWQPTQSRGRFNGDRRSNSGANSNGDSGGFGAFGDMLALLLLIVLRRRATRL